MTNIISVTSTITLGLLSGSLTLEAFVLVPFWRTLKPDEFFAMHRRVGPQLFRYFAPLTTAAVALPVVAAFVGRHGGHSGRSWTAAVLALVVLAFFPLFFQRANEALAARSLADSELRWALQRWARYHTGRTLLALVAFGFSAAALT